MRNGLIAAAVWSAFAFGFVLYEPLVDSVSQMYWAHPVACMRLVGRTAACEELQAVVNEAWWRFHLLPEYLMILAGYVAIALLWGRGWWRRRTAASPPTTGGRP